MVIPGRKEVFREVLQKFKTKIGFLQEVKSFKFDLYSCMGYACNDSFWATYHVQGRGGVVLYILSYLYSFIITLGSDLRNCCMWIAILSRERLQGFHSVYVPNLSLKRMHLWMCMETSIQYVEWIIGEYFNMVEWDGDRGGGVGFMISGSEKQAWSKCKSPLQLFNPNWGKKGIDYSEWFTWSNFRQGFVRTRARIDRIYCSRDDISFFGNTVQLI
jgi:hypothetical protein